MHILKKYLPVFFIFSLWFLFASPYVLNDKVPFPSRYLVTFFQPWQPYYGMPSKNNAMPDIITQIYPWRYHSIRSLQEGGWGLWNPYSFSGTVHAGNYQSAPFFPLNVLFFILPFIDAWSVLVLLQPLLAGIGMYLFLRSLSRSVWAAVFGSIAFMFCGFMTVWMAYGTLGWAIAFLPIILFGVNTINHSNYLQVQQNGARLYLFSRYLISLGIGFSFLAGHFQMSVYVLLVVLGFSYSLGKRVFLQSLPYLLLGILLALPQIAVAVDSFSRSARSENFIVDAGIPLRYLITTIAPDFFGNPVTRNDWFGQYAEWASYIGVLPFLFALYALFYKKNNSQFFLVLGVISMLLATASPVSTLFYQLQIPVLSTSVATRMILLFCVSCIVFASAGFDALFTGKQSFRKKEALFAGLIVCSLIAVLWGLTVLLPGSNVEYQRIAQRNMILPTILILYGLVVFWLRSVQRLRVFLLVSVLIFTGFDLYRYAAKWMPFEERQYVFPDVPVVTYLQKQANGERVFSNAGNEMNTYFGIPSIEGYDAMFHARYGEFVSAAGNGSIQPLERSVVKIDRGGVYTKRWFDLLGVRYLIHRISDGRNVWVFPHWNHNSFRSVYKDEHYEVFENQTALPKVYLADSYQIETEKQNILNTLAHAEFPYQKTVILEKEISTNISSESGAVRFLRQRSGEVNLETVTDGPKILVRTEAHDPGWRVYVNNVPQELLRVNYTLQGVVVPAGTSTVRFEYTPMSIQIGLIGQATSIFVLGVASMRQLLHDRRIL